MKFAVAASVQSNKKPVELFLIGFHSCGFLYTNRHPAEQKKKNVISPQEPAFSCKSFLFFIHFLTNLAASPIPELDPEENKRTEPALFSGIPRWCQ